jgi:hypothetical protein
MNNEPQLDSLLKRMAEDHRPELPSSGLIWWRAQILRKQQEQARIERPVMIMRRLATAVCLAMLFAWVVSGEQQSQIWLGRPSWFLWLCGGVVLAASLVSTSFLWPVAKRR